MCVRHAEENPGDLTCRWLPLWNNVPQPAVLIVVDVLCANPHCLFRCEETWFQKAIRRGQNRSCGSSSCLTANRCSFVVLSPLSSAIRRRFVLRDSLVD